MNRLLKEVPIRQQYFISLGAVLVVVLLSLLIHEIVGYRAIAFFLLVTISLLSLFLDILPLVLAAILSALLWNFIFIPPRFTFSIGTSEDQVLLLMYFIIVLIHAVLTAKIRQAQQEVRKREERSRDLKFYNTLLNSLSHELRTPITTIMGATDNLLASENKLSETTKHELLNEINIASIRLNRQVENLLGVSRLESGAIKIRKDWVDVRELIYTTLGQFDPTFSNHSVTVSAAESLPLFKLDFALMEQVLFNLINNAIQHTSEGTSILISANCVEEKLLIAISDTGKGFPEKEIDRVFDKFYRAHGSRPGGTGLGLSIVRGFIEAHGGTITLRNLPLSGAEFTIILPTELTYLNNLKHE
ncbi:MAG: PAS domain-containing sensor histidine kinase [Bacteroidetes bacterium]|nr:PAS domain-containing sensor histidine kinase [Bacteroidota bacterium]